MELLLLPVERSHVFFLVATRETRVARFVETSDGKVRMSVSEQAEDFRVFLQDEGHEVSEFLGEKMTLVLIKEDGKSNVVQEKWREFVTNARHDDISELFSKWNAKNQG